LQVRLWLDVWGGLVLRDECRLIRSGTSGTDPVHQSAILNLIQLRRIDRPQRRLDVALDVPAKSWPTQLDNRLWFLASRKDDRRTDANHRCRQ
jgi:hypothetical protein